MKWNAVRTSPDNLIDSLNTLESEGHEIFTIMKDPEIADRMLIIYKSKGEKTDG